MDDIKFLEEMLERLTLGRNGDATQFEMLEKMMTDWLEEFRQSAQQINPVELLPPPHEIEENSMDAFFRNVIL